MPNKKAVDYLNQNKNKFDKAVLVSKLRSLNYPESVIQEAAQVVYGQKGGRVSSSTGFFDFKNKRIYMSGGEEAIDFLFGLFGIGVLVWIIVAIISELGYFFDEWMLLFIPIILILIMIQMFKKRRYIFKGMLLAVLLPIIAAFVAIIIFWRYIF